MYAKVHFRVSFIPIDRCTNRLIYLIKLKSKPKRSQLNYQIYLDHVAFTFNVFNTGNYLSHKSIHYKKIVTQTLLKIKSDNFYTTVIEIAAFR